MILRLRRKTNLQIIEMKEKHLVQQYNSKVDSNITFAFLLSFIG